MNRLIQGDCLEVMPQLIAEGVRVDLVLTDVPYGTIEGLKLNGSSYQEEDSTTWDVVIPIIPMMKNISDIMRAKAHCILFSGGMLTPQLRLHHQDNLEYLYPLYWKKNIHGNSLTAKKAPLSYIEELGVWFKPYDVEIENPLRQYSKKILEYIQIKEGVKTKKAIMNKMGHQGIDHFTRFNSVQFGLPTRQTYNQMIQLWQIDQLNYFIPYEEMIKLNKINIKTFNLPDGHKSTPNVLEYAKPSGSAAGLHPTQKPIEMLEYLILQYTNEGDTVLDFTMGSGSTAIACMRTNRNFIGIELDETYYNIAAERIATEEPNE